MTRFLLVRAVMVRVVFAVGMCGLISCSAARFHEWREFTRRLLLLCYGRDWNACDESSTRDLSRDEAAGGHILRKHVGRSDEQLRERLEREPTLPGLRPIPAALPPSV